MQQDTEEKEVSKLGMQPSTEMQKSIKVQPNVMEINMSVIGSTKVRKPATIMDKTTLLDKGIRIPDPDRFMWI
jgi:hypothetical protein